MLCDQSDHAHLVFFVSIPIYSMARDGTDGSVDGSSETPPVKLYSNESGYDDCLILRLLV